MPKPIAGYADGSPAKRLPNGRVSQEVLKGKPPILRLDIAGNVLSIIVIALAGMLGSLLVWIRIR